MKLVHERGPWAAIRARWGAFGMDTLLLAYAAGCVHLLMERFTHGSGFLTRHPHLLVAAPVLAAAWQSFNQSLGQLGYRVGIFEGDAPARANARFTWGALAALQATAIGIPALVFGSWGGSALALVGVCAVSFLSKRSLPERLSGTSLRRYRPDESVSPRPWYQGFNAWFAIGILAVTFAICFHVTRFDLGALTEGAGATQDLVAQLVSPDWSIAGKVAMKMVETVALALLASTMAIPFAFGLSFLGARNIMMTSAAGQVVYTITRLVMNVMRSIEPLVWAIVFTLWVGVGPFAGMLALFVHSVAALGKLYSESIESIDPGPVEAMKATGARNLQVLRYGVVPQVVPPFLSFTVYRWDINVRMATILGLVGGGGIGEMLINYQQIGAWSKVGTILLFITLVVWVMDLGSSKARERLT